MQPERTARPVQAAYECDFASEFEPEFEPDFVWAETFVTVTGVAMAAGFVTSIGVLMYWA